LSDIVTNEQNRFSLDSLPSRSSDVTFSMKLVLYGALIGVGIYLVFCDAMLLKICGTFLLGSMFAHGVELQHQVLHAQGFHNKVLNETVGILLGLPMLVSYADYKSSHMHHHKYLGTPENREFFDYGDQYGALTLRSASSMLLRIFMIPHYFRFVKNVATACRSRQYEHVAPDVSKRISRDYLIMLAVIVAFSAASTVFGLDLILRIWMLPLMLVATPLHALIEMPEHFRCNTDSKDVFVNTRTIKSNTFMNWFTNGNNYHVEHHLLPGLPIDRLHDLHAKIHAKCQYNSVSYRAFYWDLLRSMIKGN
jgi:fatty acid desaturase